MEDIPAIAFVYGAAIIVGFIVIKDLIKKKKEYKPSFKWIIVVLLSVWQVGCWRALNNFDSAFGNSTDIAIHEIIFIFLVTAWLIYQAISYIIYKKRSKSFG